MSVAVESEDELILEGLKTRLAGIVSDGGVTTWHTMDAVVRPDDITERLLDPSYTTICAVVPERVDREELTFTQTKATMHVGIRAATKFHRSTENPYSQEEPIRQTVMTRLAKDVENRLRSDRTVGGLALHLRVTGTDYEPERTWWEGWAMTQVNVQIEYAYEDGAL